jgi:hypothetical protein
MALGRTFLLARDSMRLQLIEPQDLALFLGEPALGRVAIAFSNLKISNLAETELRHVYINVFGLTFVNDIGFVPNANCI